MEEQEFRGRRPVGRGVELTATTGRGGNDLCPCGPAQENGGVRASPVGDDDLVVKARKDVVEVAERSGKVGGLVQRGDEDG